MTDITALQDQARAAGAALVDEYGPFPEHVSRELLVAFAAIAWLEGRGAGGNEALAIVRRALEELR